MAAGTLQIGAGGTTGAITGSVANAGALVFNRSDALSLGGVISGSGSLTQVGSGTLTLTGNNTYSGGTTITAGGLQLGAGGTTGAITGNVANAGVLSFNRSDAVGFGGVVSGVGSLTQAGSGTLTLTAAQSYSGSTTIAAGSLQLGTGGTVGSLTGDVANAGTLVFNRSDAVSFGGVVSGSGSLRQAGSGALTLTGANSYSGGTTVAAGSLQVGVGGTAGAIVGNVTNNGALVFNRSDAFSLSGAVSGTGSLSQVGTGILTLTGANSYSGGTTVAAGTLQVGAGGATGALTGNVVNSAALVFNRTNALSFGGVVSGSGSLTQAGSGTLTLSGANTYTGGTTVAAGVLATSQAQRIAAGTALTVAAGASLLLTGNQSLNTLDLQGTLGGTGSLTASNSATLAGASVNTGLSSPVLTSSGNTTVNAAAISSGSATVNGGSLTLGAGGSLSAPSITVAAGSLLAQAALQLNASAAVAVASGATLSLGADQTVDSLSLLGTLGGSGVLTATSSATLAGGTVNAGLRTALLASSGASALNAVTAASVSTTLSSGTLTLGPGGSLNTPSMVVASGTLATTGLMQLVGQTALDLAPGSSLALGADTSLGSLAGSGSVVLGSATLTAGSNGSSTVFDGALIGAGGLVKQGVGSLTLTGANAAHAGNTTVAAGTLVLDGVAAGTGSGGLDVGAGRLQLDHGVSVANAVTVSTGVIANTIGSATLTAAGSLTLQGVARLQVSGAGLAVAAPIGEALGAQGLDITGGLLTLSGANSFSGPVRLRSGSLVLQGGAALANSVALTLDNSPGVLLQLQASETLGSLAGGGALGGNVNLGSHNLSLGSNGASTVYAGVLSGSGGLNKLGTGTLTLSGAHSLTGTTTVSAGTLALDNALALPASAVHVGSGARLALVSNSQIGSLNSLDVPDALVALGSARLNLGADNSDARFGGVISGSGSVQKQGTGQFTLSGANTYSGATQVDQGSLRLDNAAVLSNSAVTLADAAGVALVLLADARVGTLAGGGGLGGAVQLGSFSLSTGGNDHDSTYAGTVSGSGGLVKQGSGNFTLAGPNSFAGPVQVQAGRLTLQGGAALADGVAVSLLNTVGAELALSDSETLGSLAGGGALGGNLALGVNTLRTGGNGASSQYAGAISGSGALVKQGAGTLALTAASSYSGGTLVSQGVLAIDADNRLGSTSGALTLAGGTLRADADLSLAATRRLNVGAGGGTLDSQSHDLGVAGELAGSAALVKRGSGSVQLAGANSFDGNLTVSAGTLKLSNSAVLPQAAVMLDNSPGVALALAADGRIGSLAGGGAAGGGVDLAGFTLSTGGLNTSTLFAGSISGSGGLVKQGSGQFSLSGSNSFSGPVQVQNGTLRLLGGAALADGVALSLDNSPGVGLVLGADETIGSLAGGGVAGGDVALNAFTLRTGGNGATSHFAGQISGSGGLVKQGAGTWTLDGGANSFAGGTVVNAGVLAIDSNSRLGAAAAPLTLDGGGLQAMADLTLAASRAVVVGAAGGSINTLGQTVTLDAVLSGAGNLQKLGAGTLVLNQANSLTGATRVSAGTLRLNNPAVLPASAVTLDNTPGVILALAADARIGSLAGGGAAGGNVELGSFTLSTGADGRSTVFAGALNGTGGLLKEGSGSLTLSGNNHYTGDTTLAGGSLLLLGGAALPSGGTLTLADVAGLQLVLQDDQTIGALAGGGPSGGNLVLGTHSLSTGGNDRSTRFAGVVSGSGGVVKQGLGNFTLAGANTFSGPVAVQGGTLTLQGGAALTDGVALSLANAAGVGLVLLGDETVGSLAGGGAMGGNVTLNSFTLRAGGNQTSTVFGGVLSGSGGLVKQGAGSLTLGGTNTFSGPVTVAGGTLALQGAAALADGASVALSNSAGVRLALLADETLGTLSGGGQLGGDVALNAFTLRTGGNGASSHFAGQISGSGSLVKQGAGTFTLDGGDNSYSGGTRVEAGVLAINSDRRLGNAASALTLDGGRLQADADLTLVASRGLVVGAGGGSIDTQGRVLTVAGVLSGAAQFEKLGLGTLVLAGANSLTGPTQVSAGTLRLNHAQVLSASAVTLADSAGVALTLAADATIGSLAGGGASGGLVDLAGHTLRTGGDHSSTAFAGPISGAGGLDKQGSGVFTLQGANSFAGPVRVMQGTLALQGGAALADGVAVTLDGTPGARLALLADETIGSLAGGSPAGGEVALAGHTLSTGGNGSSTVFAGVLSGSGGLVKQGAGQFTLSGANLFTGPVRVQAGTLALQGGAALADGVALSLADVAGAGLLLQGAETLGSLAGGGALGGGVDLAGFTLSTGGNNTSTQFAGAISGSGGLVKQGSGEFSLSGSNSFSGPVRVQNGMLRLQGGAALADGVALSLDNQAGAVLVLAADETLGSLAGGGAAGGDVALNAFTLRTGGNGASTQFAGRISGNGGLVKQGTGTWTLNGGANSFAGGTLVQAGVLAIDNDSRLGAAAAPLTLDGGRLQANSDLTLGADRTLQVAAGGGSIDTQGQTLTLAGPLAGSGALEKRGAGTLVLAGAGSLAGATQVNAGTLRLSHLAALPASAVTLADAAGVSLALATDTTVGSLAGGGAAGGTVELGGFMLSTGADHSSTGFAGVIGGAGGLLKQGSGSFALSGANRYTGGTTVAAGSLVLQGGAALADAGAVHLADVAGVRLVLQADEALGALSGGGALGGEVVLGTFTLTAGASAGASAVLGGVISGSGGLVKRGSDSLALAGANRFTGPVQVEDGRLELRGGAALPASAAVTLGAVGSPVLVLAADQTLGSLAGAGRVELDRFSLSTGGNQASTVYSGVIAGSGGLVKQGDGRFSLSGANTFSGPVSVQGGTLALQGGAALADGVALTLADAAGVRLVLEAAETLGSLAGGGQRGGGVALGGFALSAGGNGTDTRFAGSLSSAGGGGSLVKQGSGTLTLAGSNSYSGDTRVEAGTLSLAGHSALPDNSALVLANTAGAVLDLQSDQVAASLAGGGAAGGSVALNRYTLRTGGSDASTGFAGTLSGSGGLVKQGSGSFTLNGANSFSGGTTVTAGRLVLAGGAALADSGAVVLAPAAGVELVLTADETIGSLAGGGAAGGRVALGSFTLRSGGNGASTTFSGSIGGSGGLVKQGDGAFSLAGANSFAGPVRIETGALVLQGGAALADGVALSLADRAGARLVLQADETVGSLAGGGPNGGGVELGGFTLAAGGNHGSTVYGGSLSGTGGLVKQGSGSLTLAGVNSNTGPTRVEAGTLVLQGGGAIADSAAVTLANLAGVVLVLQSDETVGSLSGGGAVGGEVQLGGQVLATGVNGASTRFDGVISGAGTLAKLGSGRLTLTGTNTYAGGTQLRGGELAVAADAQLGSLPPEAAAGPLLFDGGSLVATDSFVLAAQRGLLLQGAGAVLSVDTGKTLQISSSIADGKSAGSLSKTGGGRLLLSNPADNGFTGATQVLDGVLGISRDGQLGRAPDALAAQHLVLDGGSLLVQQDMRLADTRGLLLGASGGRIEVEAGRTLQLGGTVSSAPLDLAALPPGSLAGSLSKLGAGRLLLDGVAVNHYAGATRVLAGVLAIQRDGQLGDTPTSARAGHLLLDGGALQAEASTVLDARRGLALGRAGGEIGVAAGQTLAYAGLIADAEVLGAPGALHKSGAGLLDLSGSQTSSYRGATRVSGGVLAISADRQLGSVPVLDTPGQLLLDGGSLQAAASLRLASQRGLLLGSAGGTLTVAAGQTLSYAGTLGDLAPAGVAAPAGRLVKAGAGRLTLDNPGNNSFAGGSTLLAGELAVARDGQLGAVPALATPDQLRLDGGSLMFTDSGVLASTRGIGLGPAGGTLAVAAGAELAYGGVVADVAALPGVGLGAFSKTGAGQLNLSGDSHYAGTTRVLAGTLATVGDQRLPSAGSLQIANAARLQLGGDLTLAAVGDLAGQAVDGTARLDIGSHSLTVNIPVAATGAVFGGMLVSADGQLVKRGEGLLQLGGSTSGASLLRVEQGTLLSVGPAAFSAETQLRVAAAATLRLNDEVTAGSLLLRGSLTGPGRLRTTGGVMLDGALVDSPVSAGVLSSQGQGVSLLNAPVSVSGATTLDASLTLGTQGTLQAGLITLHNGATLTTLASGRLLPGAVLQADSGSRLQLAGSETVAGLSLAGTLGGAGVLDVTGDTALSGARVDTSLRSTVLSSQGASQINAPVLVRQQASLTGGTLTLGAAGSLDTPKLTLLAGELLTTAAQALAGGTALVVAAPATLRLGAEASVRSLQLAGTLARTGAPAAAGAPEVWLTATESAQLDSGQVRSALRTPRLSSQGNSLLAAPVLADTSATLQSGSLTVSSTGLLSSPLLQLQAGRLLTQGAQGLAPSTTLQMAPGSVFSLGGEQSLAALADLALAAGAGAAASAAQVNLAEHSLSVGSAGNDAVFGGQLLGSGSLVKQGAGRLLLSADQFYGATQIEAGTLQIGNGGAAGSLGSGAVLNNGSLRFVRSGSITLANTVSGSGAVEQAGAGNLTLSAAGNAWTGITQVSSGALLTGGANRLPDQSSVRVAAGARLELGGDETVHDISADGAVSLAGSVTTKGDQRYRGPITLLSPAIQPVLVTLTAPGHTIEARHDDNQWGTQPLSLVAGQVLLSAGRAAAVGAVAGPGGAPYRDLVLGSVTLSGLAPVPAGAVGAAGAADAATASVIDAGRLQIGASVTAGQAAAGDARRDGLLQLDGGALTLHAHAPASYAILPLVPGEGAAVDPAKGRQIWVANDVISQSANSLVLTRDGAGLLLKSSAGGSINLGLLGNRFEGGVSALSGAAWNTAWAGVDLPGGRETGQSRITLGGQVLQIGGQGLEADLIRLSAARLGTDVDSRIVARLWYSDAGSGISNSTPGLQIRLLNEAFSSPLPAGSSGEPINVSIGDRSLGVGREGLSAGYVQILPKQHGAGSTAVFLSGPKVGVLGYSFFHDGAGDQLEVPVYYNGVLPATPQLSGSLSAVASVSESARRERFEEAVRTENVAIRLRAGVIAEVGPGRSATQGSQGLKLPATCPSAGAVLGCEASP